MELERCCSEEQAKLLKNKVSRACGISDSKRLEALIATKGASTNYSAKAVNNNNTGVQVISEVFNSFGRYFSSLLLSGTVYAKTENMH